MNKGGALVISVIAALICMAILSGLEAAVGMFGGSLIAFINAAIGYFGGRALYRALLRKKSEEGDELKEEPQTHKQVKDDFLTQSRPVEASATIADNSTLGETIAECNIPDILIPRVLELYKKDPQLITSLHGVFSVDQLEEILTGMERRQDVSFIMNENLTAEQMHAIRENLPTNSN